MPLLLAQTSTFHEVKYGLPVNFQPDFLCSQSPWEVYMLDPVRPSPVRANKLGRSLSQFALRDTANRSCWPVGPRATMQHSVAAMGCPCVCLCACGQLMIQGQQSPINMPMLCKGHHSLGFFLSLLVILFLIICLLKIGSSFPPSGAPSTAKERSEKKLHR